jgi:hypothetical protein
VLRAVRVPGFDVKHDGPLEPGVTRKALEASRLSEVSKGSVAFQRSILAVHPRRRYLPLRVRAYIDHLAERIGG